MIFKPFIGLVLFLCAGVSFAQWGSSPEKTALRNIEKKQWQKAETRLRKALAKDRLNPATRYVLSRFFFHPDNPAFNLDSAYHYAVTALNDYAVTPVRARDRLFRIAVDSLGLIRQRADIDSTAFAVAREKNTEAAYMEFLSHFPSSVRRELARELRNEVAFQEVVKENTHEAFKDYLTRYPESARAAEARSHYDLLLYQDYTRDGRLDSYERFLSEYPDTPFREEIDQHIFEILTADGSVDSFLNFISRYPSGRLAKEARYLIFHILKEEEFEWPHQFLNDSLRNILALNKTYLVPVLQGERYGFIDENGKEILAPMYKDIPEEYLCGHITDEVLVLDGNLVSRTGTAIYPDAAEEIDDLGSGFLMLRNPQGSVVIHKGGFGILDQVDDARILNKRYIAARKGGSWNLYTLTGRLLDKGWDNITAIPGVIVFSRENKLFLTPIERVSECANGLPLKLSDPLDEVKPWPQNLIWGRAGEYEGVLDESLQGLIGFDKHTLIQTFFGAIATLPNGYAMYNWMGKRSSTFAQVKILGNRVGVKNGGSWLLVDPVAQDFVSQKFDSVRVQGPFVVGMAADSVYVFFEDRQEPTAFYRPLGVAFVPGMDSTSFLSITYARGKKEVFDLRGRFLFSAAFDAIEYAGQGVFVTTRSDKKGLIDHNGKNLLSAEYDGVGSARGQVLSLLKNKKFGAYNLIEKKLIKPQYDRNLQAYSPTLLITYKNGAYGFIGWDNRPVSAFNFDEITYWEDSVALVRQGVTWHFYDVAAGKAIESNLRKVTMVRDDAVEKIAIIQKENLFGVISNRRGMVIPLTFSDIVNLGSADEPLYFTEKHIREASLFVVIYYDRHGEMLRKEIYEDAAEYDKLYCSDN